MRDCGIDARSGSPAPPDEGSGARGSEADEAAKGASPAASPDARATLDELIPLVFEDLRRLARKHMRRERPGHTLRPTALVCEVYLRLVGAPLETLETREQFFAAASRLIRQILVDHARERSATKRGGRRDRLPLEPVLEAYSVELPDRESCLALDEALCALARQRPRQARLVELRFFIGLTMQEAADVLGISRATATREWSEAKGWLATALEEG
jgi:RNA polymerase sigma factor (TIGR02999 family)